MANMLYKAEISHEGLGKYRVIKGSDRYTVEQKANAQIAEWEKMWQRKVEIDNKKQERIDKLLDKQAKLSESKERTREAEGEIETIVNTLSHALSINDAIDLNKLKDRATFKEPKPQEPKLVAVPPPPNENDPKYKPSLDFFDLFLSKRRQNKIDEAQVLYFKDTLKWKNLSVEITMNNEEIKKKYTDSLPKWEAKKQEYLRSQREKNEAMDRRKEEYLQKIPGSIVDYCDLVLSRSEYPNYFPQEFEIDYNTDNGVLIVDYFLPSPDDLPSTKEVKYIQSKDMFVETKHPEVFLNKIYDNLIYQIALRTIHELYEADIVKAIDSIVFNGIVQTTDKGTGNKITACILSINTKREEFFAINLANVDPKECFKKLKGVGSSKLHSITPVAPIVQMNREDKRFVSSYGVADSLDDSCNLAAMDWEDFEHLVREVFEKEFSQSGGEVKITRASRDAGVDAVAFDPDPIRGGKIVIQAKRYTNTVGVSAVRDLYGTVLNEGATKGILVTTTDYGPDAYDFAKGKPLTLLNGANLLHLLDKHGHKATIDVKAAKQEMAARS